MGTVCGVEGEMGISWLLFAKIKHRRNFRQNRCKEGLKLIGNSIWFSLALHAPGWCYLNISWSSRTCLGTGDIKQKERVNLISVAFRALSRRAEMWLQTGNSSRLLRHHHSLAYRMPGSNHAIELFLVIEAACFYVAVAVVLSYYPIHCCLPFWAWPHGMAQSPGMCTLWCTSVLNSNRTSGSQRVRAKRCQSSRVLAIFPLRAVTDAASAMMEKLSADVVCPNFPLSVQLLGLVGNRFVVTWKKGHLLVLLIINK